MSKINDGGPAFPMPCGNTGPCDNPKYNTSTPGISVRDYFAASLEVPEEVGTFVAKAVMGEDPPQWSSSGDHEQSLKCVKWWAEMEAKYRYIRADAMLAARQSGGAS